MIDLAPGGVYGATMLLPEEFHGISEMLALWPPSRLRETAEEVLRAWGYAGWSRDFPVRWNARLRTTVGRALVVERVVELNPRLLARHPGEVREVLVHELAHLVVLRLHGTSVPDHGAEWKALMRQAGCSERATHDLDVSGLRQARRRRRRRLWL